MTPRVEVLVMYLALLLCAVVAAQTNASSAEEPKDKRTREDIMFGNQQNKPAAIMEDILAAADSKENDTKEEDVKKSLSRMDDSPDYSGFLPAAEDSAGYGMVDPQILYDMPDLGDYPPYDVTNALFRRKRQLTRTPRAAFRSSLGQLMGRRLSRSAFRSKRQAVDRDAYYLLEQMPMGYETPELGYPAPAEPEESEQAPPSPLWFLSPQRRAPVPWYPPDLRYVRLPAKRGWGRFQPDPDMARLYALANLLADTEQPEFRGVSK